MLRHLRIRELAIIEDLTVEFGDRLNLLTGETGAGKSILVDALGLVAGRRADATLVRKGAERGVVEALFEGCPPELTGWLDERGLDADPDGGLSVRRELAAAGGGRVFVNGSATTVGTLRELASLLLDLHGQHEQQHLQRPERHLLLLDRFGGLGDVVEAVRQAYDTRRALLERREELRARAGEAERRAEELRERILRIDAVSPRPDERDELDRERELLRNAGQVAALLAEALAAAHDAEPSAASLAARVADRLARLAEIDPSVRELAERARSAELELADVGASLRDYRDARDFDPERLEHVESRRAAIDELCLRYGSDESEVLRARAQAAEDLEALEDMDGTLARLDERLAQASAAFVEAAGRLGRARRRAAKRLVRGVEEQLADLALPEARLEVEFRPAAEEALTVDGRQVGFGAQGGERIELQFTANPGEPARPLARVASGGELSRLMLALHLVLDDAAGRRTQVFDEVDAGLGGAVADAIGGRLRALAAGRQVLCITHLPQVAAYADRHYHVQKHVQGGRTRAAIAELDDEARVNELARMLGGKEITDATRDNASELLGAVTVGRARRRRTTHGARQPSQRSP